MTTCQHPPILPELLFQASKVSALADEEEGLSIRLEIARSIWARNSRLMRLKKRHSKSPKRGVRRIRKERSSSEEEEEDLSPNTATIDSATTNTTTPCSSRWMSSPYPASCADRFDALASLSREDMFIKNARFKCSTRGEDNLMNSSCPRRPRRQKSMEDDCPKLGSHRAHSTRRRLNPSDVQSVALTRSP